MEEHKMQWLIDRVKNGEVDNVIAKTGKKKGSVVAPTGYGKFGFICEDMKPSTQIVQVRGNEKVIKEDMEII